jgi:hypothetical protein
MAAPVVTTASPRSARWPTWLLVAGVAVLFVLLAAGGLVAWVGSGLSRHAPAPDTSAYARSAAVQRRDLATATWFSAQLRQLGRQAAWLRPAGQSVLDYCRADGSAAPSGGAARWSLSCQRSQAAYFVYGGASAGRIRQLERVLTGQGWGDFTISPASPASPLELSAGSTGRGSPAAIQAGLRASWISPARPQARRRDIGRPVVTRSRLVAWRQVRAANLSEISRALTGQRDIVLVVTLSATYATRGGPGGKT